MGWGMWHAWKINLYVHCLVGLIDLLISVWVQGLLAPMHLGLNLDGPFVPHIESWEPHSPTIVPDGPQA